MTIYWATPVTVGMDITGKTVQVINHGLCYILVVINLIFSSKRIFITASILVVLNNFSETGIEPGSPPVNVNEGKYCL